MNSISVTEKTSKHEISVDKFLADGVEKITIRLNGEPGLSPSRLFWESVTFSVGEYHEFISVVEKLRQIVCGHKIKDVGKEENIEKDDKSSYNYRCMCPYGNYECPNCYPSGRGCEEAAEIGTATELRTIADLALYFESSIKGTGTTTVVGDIGPVLRRAANEIEKLKR